MKILYLDCSMGASGDMLSGALLGLAPSPQDALEAFNAFGIPGVEFSVEDAVKGGISAWRLRVTVHGEEEGHGGRHHHHHRRLGDVCGIIDSLAMKPDVKASVKEVYRSIASAEARAHGTSVEEVHFHEVGALDAIADVSAACWLMDAIGAAETVASPLNTGMGTIECAHGILPVPAPATAFLLEGMQSYSDGVTEGELTTPTGAALVRRFAKCFGARPPMTPLKTAYGAGSRDFARPNVLCAVLGEAVESIEELVFNIDDMTGEAMAFAVDRIFEAGAKDVAVADVAMKKGRPGWTVTVLCGRSEKESVANAIFRHTSTIGFRERTCARRTAARREAAGGCGGRVKVSEACGAVKCKAEADDAARIAISRGMAFDEAKKIIEEGAAGQWA